MIAHLFNPEHDIALAHNQRHLTIPHAAQELRMNLSWIPALWAKDGDVVMVDDVPYAVKAAQRSGLEIADVLFLNHNEVKGMTFDGVMPWGWDEVVCTHLKENGINLKLMPNDKQLAEIRRLSNRQLTIKTQTELRKGIENETCGEATYATSMKCVTEQILEKRRIVLKAPWSSSGRGIRYVNNEMAPNVEGWVKRIIRQQGGVMIEPLYCKVKDFGMEFFAQEDGTVRYAGLSLFHTTNGAYAGNILATESEKMRMLANYIPETLTKSIIQHIERHFAALLRNIYIGPFGIDMMVVTHTDGRGFLLHPCVEINLRRTMGHVALSITPDASTTRRVMSIIHNVNYKLKVNNLKNDYVQTL